MPPAGIANADSRGFGDRWRSGAPGWVAGGGGPGSRLPGRVAGGGGPGSRLPGRVAGGGGPGSRLPGRLVGGDGCNWGFGGAGRLGEAPQRAHSCRAGA